MTQRPGHVLLTTDTVGGVWTYSLDLAEGLLARGVDVSVAVLGPAPSHAQHAAAARLGAQVIETGCPLDWRAENARIIEDAGRVLADLAAGAGVDLVHLHAPAFAAGRPFEAPAVGSCHSCMATWWEAVKGGQMPEDFHWRTMLLARGYAACDQLIAPSQSFAAATAGRYGVCPSVVWNGRAPVGACPASQQRTGVITSGRLWDEGKNVITLDRAAGAVDVRIKAAGDLKSPDGGAVPLRHIEALGRLEPEDLALELSQAAIFASLALYEPFGLGVLEAANAGCALVLSDIPTFRELWDGAALFVPATDAAAASTALNALLQDPIWRAELSACSGARARRYSLDAMVDGVLAVYAASLDPQRRMQEVAA